MDPDEALQRTRYRLSTPLISQGISIRPQAPRHRRAATTRGWRHAVPRERLTKCHRLFDESTRQSNTTRTCPGVPLAVRVPRARPRRSRLFKAERRRYGSRCGRPDGAARSADARRNDRPSRRRPKHRRGGHASKCRPGWAILSRRGDRDLYRQASWRGTSHDTTRRCCRACHGSPKDWRDSCRL